MNVVLYRWIAGFLLAAGILIAGAGLVPASKTGPAPLERNWVYTQLDAEHTIAQTFTSARPGLAGLRVLLFARPINRDDPVTLRLRYADDGVTPDLAVVTLPVRELNSNGWTTFRFSPFDTLAAPYADAATLLLILEAPTITRGEGINVIAGPDTYAGGRLFVADEELGFADLAFEPVYAATLLDRVMPVSILAAGKPGLFGRPGFYGVICGMYLVILALALFAATNPPGSRLFPVQPVPGVAE